MIKIRENLKGIAVRLGILNPKKDELNEDIKAMRQLIEGANTDEDIAVCKACFYDKINHHRLNPHIDHFVSTVSASLQTRRQHIQRTTRRLNRNNKTGKATI